MAKQQYSASEAAAALGISLDTLRRWDRAGQIRVTRDRNNRRVGPPLPAALPLARVSDALDTYTS